MFFQVAVFDKNPAKLHDPLLDELLSDNVKA
jgi:hypothetical protein